MHGDRARVEAHEKAEKENVDIKIAPETQKLNWYVAS